MKHVPPGADSPKLRQTEAEYSASRDMATRKSGPVWGARLYVCKRCQATFQKGEGTPDAHMQGVGRCRTCLELLRVGASS